MTIKLAVVTAKVSRLGGGLFYSVRAVAQRILKKGHLVTVIGEQDQHTDTDAQVWAPLQLILYRAYLKSTLGVNLSVLRLISKGHFKLVHVHNLWRFPSIVGVFCRLIKRTYIVSPRGALDPWALASASWKKRIGWLTYEYWNLSGASCLHALSDNEADAFRRLGLKNPIAVIPNGVDIGDCPRHDNVKSKRMIFISRIHRKKGIFELIDAWRLLEDNGQLAGWSLVIAGWGSGKDIAKLCGKINDLRSIEFIGPAYGKIKETLLNEANAFILPSHSEGIPMAVLEAWANSIPTLITRECNLSIAFDTNSAYEVHNDPESLANELREFLMKPSSEILAFGDNGRRLVEKHFTWDMVSEDFEKLYKWLQGDGKKPSFVHLYDQ